MSTRDSRRAAVALAIAAILIAGGMAALVATAPARAASGIHINTSPTVQVTAQSGFAFNPNNFNQVPTNTTITVTFTDVDVQDHTFTILGRQGWVLPASASAAEIENLAFGTEYPRLFNANTTSAGAPGDQVTGTFTSPGVGWYEFICTESGHFQNGMYGFIAFGMNLPSNISVTSPDTDPGIAVFIIVGTIVSLVVIALVLGFLVGRRRGDTYEMPPQRLGYAEPDAPEAEETPPLPNDPRG